MSQNDSKTTSVTASLRKNSQPRTKKNFFRVQTKRLAPIHLSPWTAL